MADVPSSAKVVVIGAGIVGNSLVWHLARLGWRDIVQIDKGPLPNPGGSTGHASNFIFLVDHSREMADLTLDSVAQYQEMGVFTRSGGIEVARTEERMEELRRRMSSSKAWGVDSRLVSPDEIQELVPFLEKDVVVGGFYTPGVGVVDSLRAGTIMRERALELDALTVVANAEVERPRRRGGRHQAGPHQQGRHRGRVRRHRVRCLEPQGRRHGRRPHSAHPGGAPDDLRRPLPPAVGQGGRDQLPHRPRHGHLLLRAPARRRHGGRLLCPPADPHGRPKTSPASSSPSSRRPSCPFTEEDFDPQLEQAFELMPDLLGAEGAEIRYAINGLLSLTPDGFPILGETPEVRNLWSAAAVWIKEGPGVGRAVAEQMTSSDTPRSTCRHSDIARFYPHQRTRAHVRARTSEAFNKTYGIVHPGEQWSSDRPQRVAPMYDSAEGAGSRLLRGRRLGAAVLVRLQRRAPRGVRRPGDAARARVGLPLVVTDHQRRAPQDARDGRHRRPVGLRRPRRDRPGCPRGRAAGLRRPVRRARRPGRLHARARRPRAASSPTSP